MVQKATKKTLEQLMDVAKVDKNDPFPIGSVSTKSLFPLKRRHALLHGTVATHRPHEQFRGKLLKLRIPLTLVEKNLRSPYSIKLKFCVWHLTNQMYLTCKS